MQNTVIQHTVSSKTLLRASMAAVIIAAITLVTVILPAEYDIDPTGVGGALGLTVLSGNSEPVPSEKAGEVNTAGSQEFEVIEVTVPPGRGVEYKFAMPQYAKMTYEWMTDGAPLYFDLHGEPEGDTTGYFESYTISTSTEMKGSFTVPFAGSHGWYWKNHSAHPVRITLMVKGQYTTIGLKG